MTLKFHHLVGIILAIIVFELAIILAVTLNPSYCEIRNETIFEILLSNFTSEPLEIYENDSYFEYPIKNKTLTEEFWDRCVEVTCECAKQNPACMARCMDCSPACDWLCEKAKYDGFNYIELRDMGCKC